MLLGHVNTTHKIMDTRHNLYRLFSDILMKINLTIRYQPRKFPVCHIFRYLCHIQINRTFLTYFPYFSCSDVSWHQIAKFRIFFFHKIPLVSIPVCEKATTFSSGSFADQHFLSANLNCCRMILDHLKISHRNTCRKQAGTYFTGIC